MSEDKEISSNIKPENAEDSKNQKPLLTHKERESFVLKFITAYSTHKVWLDFDKLIPKSNDPKINLLLETHGLNKVPTKDNLEAREQITAKLEQQMGIVSGAISATPEVIYKTINDLYLFINALQKTHVFSGEFLTDDFAKRIDELEITLFDKIMKKVDAHIAKIRDDLQLP